MRARVLAWANSTEEDRDAEETNHGGREGAGNGKDVSSSVRTILYFVRRNPLLRLLLTITRCSNALFGKTVA